MRKGLRPLIAVMSLCMLTTCAAADGKAVILVYHHVATDTPASTSVSPDQFERHLAYLEEHDFTVWPLSRVLDALAENQPVPARTVALTFDDAYESVRSTAWPALRRRGWPFAVFVTSDPVDLGRSPYMTWPELSELAQAGVEIGIHGATHHHPHDMTRDEFRADLNKAQARIVAMAGTAPRVYAYPYGEFDATLERIVHEEGLFGVGQQSGVASMHSNLTSVPRFPISTRFAGMNDFALRVNARPLRVNVIEPESRIRRTGERNPRLVLESHEYAPEVVSCFANTGVPVTVTLIDDSRFAVQADGEISSGRSKYTCTAPSADGKSYAWYSHLWIAR
jgi:peptidoglycan/xylan/chitin deacetylase (PgdA/CDA1 family)